MKTCNCGNNSFIPVPTMIFFTKDYFSACTIVCAKCGKDYTAKIEFQLENMETLIDKVHREFKQRQEEAEQEEIKKQIEDTEDFVIPIDKIGKSVGKMVSENIVKKLQEEIETLKAENDNLIIENTDLKAEKEMFQKENLTWEDAVIKSDKEIERLSYELKITTENYEELLNNKKEPETWKEESYIVHLKSEAKEKQGVVDRCNKEIKKLWKENKELENKLYSLKKISKYSNNEEELKRAIENEKIRADGYRRNSELIASEQAEMKLEKRQIEEKLKQVKEFVTGARKIEVPGSLISCILREMEGILNG